MTRADAIALCLASALQARRTGQGSLAEAFMTIGVFLTDQADGPRLSGPLFENKTVVDLRSHERAR